MMAFATRSHQASFRGRLQRLYIYIYITRKFTKRPFSPSCYPIGSEQRKGLTTTDIPTNIVCIYVYRILTVQPCRDGHPSKLIF